LLQVRLTRGYLRSARRLAPAGSSTARKLAETLRGLSQEPVPSETDTEDLLPPVLACWTRRVPGTAIAVMFERRGDEVRVLAVRRWP
jgi:hypothetical protein